MVTPEPTRTADEVSPFSDVRCTRCGAQRLKRRDGTPGVCSHVKCPAPLHDVDVECGMTVGTIKFDARAVARMLSTLAERRETEARPSCGHVTMLLDCPACDFVLRSSERARDNNARAALILAAINACDTNKEKREVISRALVGLPRVEGREPGAAQRAVKNADLPRASREEMRELIFPRPRAVASPEEEKTMPRHIFEVEVAYPDENCERVREALQTVLSSGSEWGDGFEARVLGGARRSERAEAALREIVDGACSASRAREIALAALAPPKRSAP